MRKVILVALLTVTILSLVACGGGTPTTTAPPKTTATPTATAKPSPTQTPSATPTASPTASPKPSASPTVAPIKPTGTLTVGVTDLASEVFDPIKSMQGGKYYMDIFFDYLVGQTKDGKTTSKETGLASDWKQSDDGLTWTFNLRKGIKFHDGTEVTAKDVKFSFERATSADSVSSDKGILNGWLDTITVVDPYTVTIKTKAPVPAFPWWISTLNAVGVAIVPKDYIDKVGIKEYNLKPISSGPFLIEEHVKGDHITFKAINAPHFAIGVPKYERVIYKLVPEESSRIAMLKRGDVDVITASLEQALALKDQGFPVWEKKADKVWGVLFQQLYNTSPLQDKRVREALGLAVNKEEMLKYLFKGYGILEGSYPSATQTVGHVPRQVLPYDPAKAKQLLADAGYAKGFTLNVYATTLYPGLPEFNEALAGYWSAIGIDVKIQTLDYAGFRTKMVDKTLTDPALRGHAFPEKAFIDVYDTWFRSTGLQTVFHNADYDKLWATANAAKTLDEYAKAITAIEAFLYDGRWTLSFFETSTFIPTSKRITQWEPTAAGYNTGVTAAVSTK